MSIPVFLNSSYRYFTRRAVSDVQTVIDDFEDEALANNPAWTSPGAGLFKSPVDADGRWFDVLLTKIAVNKLEMRVRDQNGVTVCTRRIVNASGNAWNAHIFTGEYHMQIDVDSGTGWESLAAGILDQTPETQASNSRYVYGNGLRNAAESIDSQCSTLRWFMIDNNTATYADRATMYGTSSAGAMGLMTMNGTRLLRPVGMWTKPSGDASYCRFHGRRYQALLVEDGLPAGARITVPIDAGLSGLFQVTATPSASSAKIALRVG